MASTSSNTASTLSRYRPAILALTLLGAAAGIYYIHGSHFSTEEPPVQHPLRRRNAVHRLNGRRRGGYHERLAQDILLSVSTSVGVENSRRYLEACGSCMVETSRNGRFSTFLTPAVLQNTEEFRRAHGLSEAEALEARYDLEYAFLDAYFNDDGNLPNVQIPNGSGQVWDELLALGFLPDSLTAAITRYNIRLRDRFRGRTASEGREQGEIHQETNADGEGGGTVNGLDGRETAVDVNSEFSWRGESDNEPPKEGQSLLNLLYHIAEDQARREGYIHRGVTCNSCGSMPIRGIRYRCANCVDYDLCETCEAMQVHPKTHLFYKVRIPAPFLGNPRQAQPVWYPGKPSNLPQNLSREFAKRLVKDTGFENPEIEALWDQFRCLAATEWVDDPNKLNMAIDRRTFDRCFVPNTSIRPPPPNLIYDRMFAFYDTNRDGLIGFEEFLKGLASLNNKSKDERLRRVFQGYDIDGDGYVDRKDFLRMFRAFYALSKELTRDMVAGMEEDVTEGNVAKEIVLSSQPISSAFTGSIPPGERSRIGEGKRRDANGDDEVIDNQPPLRESGDDTGSMYELVADAAEKVRFGDIRTDSERQPWDSMFSDGEQVGNDHAHTFLNRTRSDEWGSIGANGGEEEPIAGASGHHWAVYNDEWPPSYVRVSDFQDALGNYDPHNEFTEQDREKIRATARQRMEKEEKEDRKDRDEVRQKAVHDRWRRREFYLDEEDGEVIPEGFKDMGGADDNNLQVESDGRSSASQPHSPALRSRSSSKVRFQDDVTDFDNETRSNASASSRNIPIGERWGGYELPEAEKDVGKEVLYQVTQQGLNEMLDPLFKANEDLAMEALATRAERNKWRKEIAQLVVGTKGKGKHKKDGAQKQTPPISQKRANPSRRNTSESDESADSYLDAQPTAPIPGYMGNVSFRAEAKRYLNQVKGKLKDQPDAYIHFLEAITAYQTKIVGTVDVIRRVAILLADCRELISGFDVFLPPGCGCNPGLRGPKLVVVFHTNSSLGTMIFSTPEEGKRLCDLFEIPVSVTPRTLPPTSPALAFEEAEELYQAVIAFDKTESTLKSSTLEQSLNQLLEDSGYSVVSPSPEEELPGLASDSHELSPASSPSDKITPPNNLSSHIQTTDQRILHTPVPEALQGASSDQGLETTELYDTSTISFPIIGHTILYSTEYLASLEPQHRIAIFKHAHNRYKQLRQQESTSATSELIQLRAQILRLLDLNIVADRMAMERRKNPPIPPPSRSLKDTHNSDTTTDTEQRPDPTLPQHRPTSTTAATTATTAPITTPSSSSSATRDTAQSRSLPFPPALPPPSILPPTFPFTTVPTPAPPAISPPPRSRLQHLARLDEVEREDKERGGKGRLSFDEFEEIMKGERGKKLGFVGAWIEMASF